MLGLSGAVLQGYLRNPLADPAVIGVSSSAALGAVTAIVLGIASNPLVLFVCAMAAAGGSMALLAALTWRQASAVQFILAGTVLTSLAGALIAFVISVAPDPYAVAEVIDWLMGALTDRGIDDVRLAAPFLILGAVVLAATGPVARRAQPWRRHRTLARHPAWAFASARRARHRVDRRR